jgi:hypothetical protein
LRGGADLKFGREGFEVGADDGSTVEVREFFGVGDRLDFLTQALWDTIESNQQGLENVLLFSSNLTAMDSLLHTLLHSLFVKLFGECHGGFLEFCGLNLSQFMAEGFFVNVGGVECRRR